MGAEFCTCPPEGWSKSCGWLSHREQARAPEAAQAQAIRQSGCRGFVPRHGFGGARTCVNCDRPYEDHAVTVQ